MLSQQEMNPVLCAGRLALRPALLLLACWVCAPIHSTHAQEVVAPDSEDAEEAVEADKIRPVLELGKFNLRDLRSASNVTAKILFSLHLALPQEADEKTIRQLQLWRHRLRDQVIIAVRKTEIKDLLEPDLGLLRRNIMLRINRLLKTSLVEEVLVTEFTFATQ